MQHYALGLSEFTTWSWSFEKDLAAYRRHGLNAIEITEFKLDPARIGKQLSTIGASGLQVSSVQAKIHAIFPTKLQPEPFDPRDRIAHIRSSIEELGSHLPARTPFVVISGAPPNGDVATVHRTLVKALKDLSRFAAERNMRLAFEPLNPSLMNVDTAIWSLADALELVEEVGEENCGLCLDTWNVWQNPDLEPTILRAGKRLFVVQISDYRRPRALYDRLIPGDGEIPLSSILSAIRRTGYAAPYVVEIFSSESLSDSIWKRDLDEVIQASIRGFERIWGKLAA